MSRMVGWVLGLALIAVFVSFARADQFCITTEPNVYPESIGWERWTNDGGAERWFEDGALVLDGLASSHICDMYKQYLPSLPNPGEDVLTVAWRVRVDQVDGFADPGLCLELGPHGGVELVYDEDGVYSISECEWIASFTAGVFHSYRLVTSDMDTYTLAIDRSVVHTGELSYWAPASFLQFGDATTGSASLSRWDYLRYGVIAIPEPGSILLCVAAVLGVRNRSRRRRR